MPQPPEPPLPDLGHKWVDWALTLFSDTPASDVSQTFGMHTSPAVQRIEVPRGRSEVLINAKVKRRAHALNYMFTLFVLDTNPQCPAYIV